MYNIKDNDLLVIKYFTRYRKILFENSYIWPMLLHMTNARDRYMNLLRKKKGTYQLILALEHSAYVSSDFLV